MGSGLCISLKHQSADHILRMVVLMASTWVSISPPEKENRSSFQKGMFFLDSHMMDEVQKSNISKCYIQNSLQHKEHYYTVASRYPAIVGQITHNNTPDT